MGTIKSAWEIALENSKDISANKELVEQNRLRDEGKRLVSKIMDDASFDVKAALKGYDAAQGKLVKEGLLQSLLANLVLPLDDLGTTSTKRLGDAVAAVVTDTRKVGMIFGQLDGFFKEYIGERHRLVDAVEKQYAPKLRKKEDDLSRQMGRPVKINPAADPEFQGIVRQYLSQLDAKYGEALDGAKEEIKALFGKS